MGTCTATRANYICPSDFAYTLKYSGNIGYWLSLYRILYIYITTIGEGMSRHKFISTRGCNMRVFSRKIINLFIVFASHDAKPLAACIISVVYDARRRRRDRFVTCVIFRPKTLTDYRTRRGLSRRSQLSGSKDQLSYFISMRYVYVCLPVHKSTNKSFSRFFDRL